MMQQKKSSDADLALLEESLQKLLAWYLVSARDLLWRKTRDPYHIWISEIMLQQTRVEAVKEYYVRFLSELPDLQSLANAPEEQVLKLWEGLGYYSRARNLKKAAMVIMEEHGGVFPSRWEEIRKLPGIGDYTAGSISSIAFGLPCPAVDGNVLRVISRLLNCYDDITEQKTKNQVTQMLKQVYPTENCSEVTQSLMELGAMICIPNGQPKCAECPLASLCRAHQKGTVAELPVKKGKAKRKIQPKTVLLLQCGDLFAIEKREEKGLLFGMWQFPNLEGHFSLEEIQNRFLGAKSIRQLEFYRHIFSHIEWEMMGYHIVIEEKISNYTWKTAEEIKEAYAIPGAFRPFSNQMQKSV